MKKRICILITLILCLFVFTGCQCEHEWTAADCTTPKVCTKCEVTDGQALGHNWAEATCVKARSCLRCSLSEGLPTEHNWQNATCSAPQTCSNCLITTGNALDHVPGDWGEPIVNYATAEAHKNRYCEQCGDIVDTISSAIYTFVDNGAFIFSPNTFRDRLYFVFDMLEGELASHSFNFDINAIPLNEGTLAHGFYDNNDIIAAITYLQDGDFISYSDQDAHSFNSIMVYFYVSSDDDRFLEILSSLVLACNPELNLEAALEIINDIVKAAINNTSYSTNGLSYMYTYVDGSFLFGITVS